MQRKCARLPWAPAWRILTTEIFCTDFNWHTYDKYPDFMQVFRKAEWGGSVIVTSEITSALLNTYTVPFHNEKWHECETQWDF